MTIQAPPHDKRLRKPYGVKGQRGKVRGALVHTWEMQPREGNQDRYQIVDFLAGKGITVPVVNDPGEESKSTIMVPLGHLGVGHGRGLTGKAWGIEQGGFARWTRKDWLKPDRRAMVEETGRWAAWFLAEIMDLPVTEKNLRRFVVGHDDDHKLGGTSDHWDPGPGYPWDVMRAAAIAYAAEKVPAGKGEKPRMVTRYRIVATKGDEKKARSYRPNALRRGTAWAVKQAKRGYRVAIRRKRVRADAG